MEQFKCDILTKYLTKISEQFVLNAKFWDELYKSNIFPREYIPYMQQSIETDENKKKNILIDLKRRESRSYEKFSNILRTLNKCDILDQYIKAKNIDAYPIVSDRPGICLIINNKEFLTCDPREGSEKDVEMFSTLFQQMNYDVRIEQDLSRRKFLELLKNISSDEELKRHDIFVSIIMSHGFSDHVVTSDFEYVSYEEILNFFSNEHCKHLKDKPKVFIYNCCRSHNVNLLEKQFNAKKEKPPPQTSLGDILEIFSTLNYYLSVRDEKSGTLFAKAFSDAMKNNPNDDICTIVTKANNLLKVLIKNDPQNRVETRQTIEQRKKGHQKNFYFSKLRY